MKHRKVKQVVQGHIASKWQSQDTNPSDLSPESVSLTTLLYCLRNKYDYWG